MPTVFGLQVIIGDLLAEDFAERRVGGVSRIGHQHAVARIGQGQRDVEYAFLGADKRLYFAGRVQIHVVPPFVEIGHGPAQFGDARCGLVAVCVCMSGFFAQRFYGLGRRGHVRTSDSQADNVLTFGVHACHFFEFHC